MKLYSTRNLDIIINSKPAIIKGLADDGGLFCPRIEDIKNSSFNTKKFLKYDYKTIAKEVFKIFLSDFSEDELNEAINGAYNNANFSDFENVITPITKIGDNYLLELYHGPTSAFKDVALTILPHFLTIASRNNKSNNSPNIYILTATSGDTGKAALSGFKDIPGIYITVFYPTDGVSKVQKLQMQTSPGDNISVIALSGNFDDCQKLIKEIYTDRDIKNLANDHNTILSSANSINIGRLVPQIVYYIYAYTELVNNNNIIYGDKVDFVVPTGNFGDILAGFIAKLLGTPIDKLICASNKNNVLTDFINTGVYNKNRDFYKTISPSMDILVSSNLERLIFLLSNNDAKYVRSLMNDLNTKGYYHISDTILSKIQESFVAYYATEEECTDAIKDSYTKDRRLIDPHTAVAYACLKKYHAHKLHKTTIILSTASPYKFVKPVLHCIDDSDISNVDEFDCMEKLHNLSKEPIPKGLKSLKDMKIRFNTTLSYIECKNYVTSKIREENYVKV